MKKRRPNSHKKSRLSLKSILLARCPECHIGQVLERGFSIRSRCPHCDYNLYPEPGFYVGAMVVGYLFAAITTIPPLIIMKLLEVELEFLIAFPFIEFIFVGTFLMIYCRIVWLHLEYQMTDRLEGRDKK